MERLQSVMSLKNSITMDCMGLTLPVVRSKP